MAHYLLNVPAFDQLVLQQARNMARRAHHIEDAWSTASYIKQELGSKAEVERSFPNEEYEEAFSRLVEVGEGEVREVDGRVQFLPFAKWKCQRAS